MDTKLKNKSKLFAVGIILTILIVLLPACAMVKFYPYFEEHVADRVRENAYEINYDWKSVITSSYVLWMEEQRRNVDENISAKDVFFQPIKLDTDMLGEAMVEENMDYEKQLASGLNEQYDSWRQRFNQIKGEILYQVYDETGQMISSNTERDLLVMETNGLEPEFGIQLVITYDNIGTPTIRTLLTKDMDVKNEINAHLYADPMEDYYDYNYDYEGKNRFQNPRNRTYIYTISNDILMEHENNSLYIDGGWYAEDLAMFIMGFGFLIGILALILPFIRILGMGTGKIYRAPLEVVFVVSAICLGMSYELCYMVGNTNAGVYYQWMKQAGINGQTARYLQDIGNVFVWSSYFFVIYWAVSCLREVFALGLSFYIKERILVCRFLKYIVKWFKKIYQSTTDIDFKQESNKTIFKIVGLNFIILAVVCTFWVFGIAALVLYSIILFFLLKKYYEDLQRKYNVLLEATNELANGNLSVRIDQHVGVFEPIKEELAKIQSGFKKAVEEETKSQRMKTELITNVSHDLKTPLTAIITYVNLLKEPETTPEQRNQYIDVLDRKSMRLKVLIEDLFEISKATSKNITLDIENVDINHLLKQVQMELEDKIEASDIEFRWNFPEEKVVLPLDGQKIYRVFENLILNITKYAMPKSRAYVEMYTKSDQVVISMKNISATEMNFNEQEITERFVRGDMARNTEGSGLGLAIARSFVELQDGAFEIQVEADLFKVEMRWSLKASKELM